MPVLFLAFERTSRGLTLVQLARAVGTDPLVIKAIESGSAPTPILAARLQSYFEIPANKLFSPARLIEGELVFGLPARNHESHFNELAAAIKSAHEAVARAQGRRNSPTVQQRIVAAEARAAKLRAELCQLSAQAAPLAARLRAASARLATAPRRVVAPIPTLKAPTITPRKRAAVAPDFRK